MERFYLGTHQPSWLGRTSTPLFISFNRIAAYQSFPSDGAPWVMDSGAFTSLSAYGRHRLTPDEYATDVESVLRRSEGLQGVVQQDWMCEPLMVLKTGQSVREHQCRTVANYIYLRDHYPKVPWIPVLQGYSEDEYHRCYDLFQLTGCRLQDQPLVGVGSVCKRQSTDTAAQILRGLSSYGLRLHAFGYKIKGLAKAAPYIISADSMAWSFDARRSPPLPGHTHKNCANCQEWAERWYSRVLSTLNQLSTIHPHSTSPLPIL